MQKVVLSLLLVAFTFQAKFSDFKFSLDVNTNLKFSWKIQGNMINMLLEKNTKGHAWFGPGDGMTHGGVYRIAKVSDGADLELTECILQGKKYPDCDNGSTKFTVVAKEATPDSFKVEIMRELSTGGPGDLPIVNGQTKFAFAMNDNDKPGKHKGDGNYGVINIDLKTGKIAKFTPWGNGKFMWHQHGQLLMWTLGADSLILLVKYGKKMNNYFEVHGWIFLLIVIVNLFNTNFIKLGSDDDSRRLLSEKINFVNRQYTSSHRERILLESIGNKELHKTIATVSIYLSLLVTIGGIFVRFAIALSRRVGFIHKNGKSQHRFGHMMGGLVLWLVVRAALATGTSVFEKLYGPTLFILLVIETVVMLCLFTLLNVMTLMNRKVKKAERPRKEGKIYEDILDSLRNKSKFIHKIF